jgi:4-diphosphocytidyl-2-C-methyl-D-erythritol kinase
LAPAKVNLGLFVGPLREVDRRHEIVTVMQAISLADEVTLEPAAGAARDELLCPGVPGGADENLAWRALQAFRAATGWDTPALRVRIDKRIPLAAGLAGGSADAAAVLRLARRASGLGDGALLLELAAALGADVPAQLSPGRWLARGVGERLRRLRAPARPLSVLVVGVPARLSSAAVYERADRLRAPRTAAELDVWARALAAALAAGAPLPARGELLHNDLQAAALSLCPDVAPTLDALVAAGARCALVSGSGPTAVGLFAGARGAELARDAAGRLAQEGRHAICARAVGSRFARVWPLAA